MVGWPSALFAGAAGAYAVQTANNHPEVVSLLTKSLRSFSPDGISTPGTISSGAANTELSVLQGEVDRLHRLLADVVRNNNGGRYTVIQTGRSGWFGMIVPVTVVGGVVYVYFRFRGWNFADFFYVTRSSLTSFRASVTEGFGKIWDEMKRTKEEFVSKILHVSQRQEQLMSQQQEIDRRLQKVGTDVDDIRHCADGISYRVELLDGKVEDVVQGVERSNRGILVLCAAIAEVTKRIPGMNKNCTSDMLENYIQTTPPQLLSAASSGGGLRGLLDADVSASVSSLPSVQSLPASGLPSSSGISSTSTAGTGMTSKLWERGFPSMFAANPPRV